MSASALTKDTAGWRLAGWPCHQTASSVIGAAMGFMSYLAADGYGILVFTAGLIATYTRLFDALIDPFLALITDRVNTRFGRLRVLTIVGRAIQVLCLFALFFWFLGSGPVVFTVICCIYYIGASICAIATHTGNAIITTDPKRRPILYRWLMIFSTVISTLISVYMSKVLFPKYRGLTIGAFQELCLTSLLVVLVLEIIALVVISPMDRPEMFPKKKSGGNVNLKDTFNVLVKNRALQMYLVAAVSDKIASRASTEAVVTTLLWGILINNYEWSGNLSMIQLPFTIFILFVGSYLGGKYGAKKTCIQWTTINMVLTGAMLLLFVVTDPTNITKAFLPTAIFVVLFIARMCANTVLSATTQSMIPDVVDYELSRSGAFVPGVIGTLQSLIDELFSSVSSTIVAFCVTMIGYVSTQPQPGDASSPQLFWMTMFVWLGLPVIGWICNYIAMAFYPLSREKMVEVQEKNAAFRAEQKVQSESAAK